MTEASFINAHRFSLLFAKISILIPGLVLVGWMFNITLLKSIVPNLVAMNPTTAFLFILSGISLYLINKENHSKPINLESLLVWE